MKRIYPQLSLFLIVYFLLLGHLSIAQEFINKLPIPYLIDTNVVALRIDTVTHDFDPGNETSVFNGIRTFAFNHVDSVPGKKAGALSILGPSIKWRYRQNVHTTVLNKMGDTTTTHWHGAHIPTYTDGGPHQPIPTDSTWDISFNIMDKSATMWYHPHLMGKTYEHVQMGLSGMVYVEDPPDGADDDVRAALHEILPNEYNVNDFPIIVQTKKFYKPCEAYQIFTEGFKSDFQYLVNGVMNPYLDVPADMVRLRVLNGDAKWAFNFQIAQKKEASEVTGDTVMIAGQIYQIEPFQQIATDAGYMDRSYEQHNLLMSPGERTEWLVDLRGRMGDSLYLLNIASDIPTGVIGGLKTRSKTSPPARTVLLKMKVGAPKTSSNIISFPLPLAPLEIPPTYSYTNERLKVFELANQRTDIEETIIYWDSLSMTCNDSIKTIRNQRPYLINQTPMRLHHVNDTVWLDSTEIWVLDNKSNVAHPFHIHLLHFNVLSIDVRTQVIDTVLMDTTEILTPIPKDSLPHIFKGPKDNVLVEPNWVLKFVAKFEDFATTTGVADSSYMFHCHILPHEDRGMMGQFVVMPNTRMTTSLEEPIIFNNVMKLYPNPARNELFLDGASEEETQIRIFDLQGRLLLTQQLSPFSGVRSIPIQQLAKGLVFVEWWTTEGRFINKVVIE